MILRIHYLQQCFGLSEPGAEEALFVVSAYRDFVGISSTKRTPDRASILRFRHLLALITEQALISNFPFWL